jgi:multiple sugar transport system substrate-binding protein
MDKRLGGIAVMVAVLCFVSLLALGASKKETVGPAAQVEGDWGAIDWRQEQGAEINVLMTSMYPSEVYKEWMHQFEALTGVEVNLELLNDVDRRNKQIVDFSSGTGEYDVGNIGYSNREEFAVAGYLEPLEEYLNDPSLTDLEWYDFEDYAEDIIASGYSDGRLVMIPFTAEWFLLWYRMDIFDQLGLEVPSTFEELEETAARLDAARRDGKISEFAWIERQMPGSSEAGWNLFCTAYRFGVEFVDFDEQVTYVNTPEGREVLEYYTRLVKQYAPPGSGNWSWPEIAEAFKTKKVAMTIGGNASYGFLEDPEQSDVAGLVGYAPPPMKPQGADPLWVWGWAINADSKNKKAAWLFIQWASSPTLMENIAPLYGVPARQSPYADPDYIEAMPNRSFIEAQEYMMTKGVETEHGLIHENYGEAADIVSREMSNIVAGIKSVEQAAADAEKALVRIGYQAAR